MFIVYLIFTFQDILLYNRADDSYEESLKVNAVVDHSGMVEYLPPIMLKSTCQIEIEGKNEIKINIISYFF